ncbi:MAG TPA: class II aldolase/adducin family protein [Streptosporangiaceae bacterium]|nr:class II aldolase/adducin family protein [Streptosporangiaceae bacterium]
MTATASANLAALMGPIPADVTIPAPPTFDSVEQERTYRKQQLAGGFRLFGKFGFSEGFGGHITVQDPEHPDCFWVNPLGMSFNQIKASDLVLVDHEGTVVHGSHPVNRAAIVIHSQVHQTRPDMLATAHAHSLHGKAFSSLSVRLEPNHPGRRPGNGAGRTRPAGHPPDRMVVGAAALRPDRGF